MRLEYSTQTKLFILSMKLHENEISFKPINITQISALIIIETYTINCTETMTVLEESFLTNRKNLEIILTPQFYHVSPLVPYPI